jgi:hypothetical protein
LGIGQPVASQQGAALSAPTTCILDAVRGDRWDLAVSPTRRTRAPRQEGGNRAGRCWRRWSRLCGSDAEAERRRCEYRSLSGLSPFLTSCVCEWAGGWCCAVGLQPEKLLGLKKLIWSKGMGARFCLYWALPRYVCYTTTHVTF